MDEADGWSLKSLQQLMALDFDDVFGLKLTLGDVFRGCLRHQWLVTEVATKHMTKTFMTR